MATHLLIWYPLLLMETICFLQIAFAGYKFQRQIALALLACIPLFGADPKKGAGHGKLSDEGRAALTQALVEMPKPQKRAIPFEPHLRRMEDEIVQQMSVKVTMRQKRNTHDIRLKVEVLIRDRTVLRYFVDLIQEEVNEPDK